MSGGKRIGVLGGTFDPIHNGHLVAASEVAHVLGLAEVIFVPTGQPWQKDDRDLAPAEDRYLMTVIATASDPLFSVSRVDIDRPGETYTTDTLRDLRLERGDGPEFFFIMGADALSRMRPGTTRRTCSHGAFRRMYQAWTSDRHGRSRRAVTLVDLPGLEISSTAAGSAWGRAADPVPRA